jgi:hypothetical protein
MTTGDATYLKHFHWMVTEGIICGLGHPVEWVTGYERAIGVPYDKIPEITEFCNLAVFELFEICNMSKAKDMAEVQAWMDSFYSAEPKGCCGGCK